MRVDARPSPPTVLCLCRGELLTRAGLLLVVHQSLLHMERCGASSGRAALTASVRGGRHAPVHKPSQLSRRPRAHTTIRRRVCSAGSKGKDLRDGFGEEDDSLEVVRSHPPPV